jgi:BolA protein
MVQSHYERIKSKLIDSLSPTHLELIDESGGHANHYESENGIVSHLKVIISSDLFKGLTKIQCHKLVNNTLKDEFNMGLHALTIKIL